MIEDDKEKGMGEMDNGDLVADFADADFVTIRPFPHSSQMAIMPVVAMKGDYVRPVGTCFAISSQGPRFDRTPCHRGRPGN